MLRLKERAGALRVSQTGAEARLWQALRGRRLARWKFRRQVPIDRYIVDFCCVDAKLVVEVDGATHSTEAELMHDRMRTQVLEASGHHVVRVTNDDVLRNRDGVLEAILAELEHRTTL